ncbi:MAG: carboxypeptidase regulatory-like domain-containing protein, partial [Bryobacteraceae bacterium]
MIRIQTLLVLLTFSVLCYAQNASLSGFIKDPSGAPVPKAAVDARSLETGVKLQTVTNQAGVYSFPSIRPGSYTIEASAPGFQRASVATLRLDVAQPATLDLTLKLGESKETVTVTTSGEAVRSADASVSTVISREFVDNLPMNGRSFNTLVELAPGTVTMPVNENSRGQYAINGQRADANYYSVDGVSANLGSGASQAPGQGASGSTVGGTSFGGTNNLVSLDALQEFRILTSTYAPEYGRTPGGQISVVTRGGSNEFHGAVSDYFRNDKLDANDWFLNRQGRPKAASRQNDFGGVIGGPIIKNRTFFFFSYEGLRLRQPNTLQTDVPSNELRALAPAAIQPYLAMFPVPSGPEYSDAKTGNGTGLAPFLATYSNPTTFNAPSIRIDHTITERLQIFGRYNWAPSNGGTRGSGSAANVLTQFDSRTQTATFGLVGIIRPTITNDLRVNYSTSGGQRHAIIDDFGGAKPLPDSQLFFPGYDTTNSFVTLRVLTGTQVSVSSGNLAKNISQQYNVIDNLSVVRGKHQLKFGVDWRYYNTDLRNAVVQNIMQFNNTGSLGAVAGTVLSGLGTSILSRNAPANILFNSVSFYAQDVWKLGSRVTLTYGFRWDRNTAPSSGTTDFIAVQPFTSPDALAVAPAGTPVYSTGNSFFAPRAGISWLANRSPKWTTVVRAGGGKFYDTAYGFMINLLAGRVFASNTALVNVPMPLSPTTPLPPFAVTAPFVNFTGVNPNLTLPRTWQWNFAVEQSLGGSQLLTATYVGSAGRGLFTPDLYNAVNPTFRGATILGSNSSKSDYNALQVQFERRFSHGFQALASYTWSHAIDTASNDTVSVIRPQNYWYDMNRGNADFDVRHQFNAAFVYQPPTPQFGGKIVKGIFGGWSIDPFLRVRTALPVDIINSRSVGNTTFASRLNLVPDQPLYIDDASVPGGVRYNSKALTIPTGFAQGTFGRNIFRGFDFWQIDFSLHRTVKLTERFRLQVRSDFFNVTNHPNFGNPSGTYSTATTFGTSTAMLGRALNSTAGGGFNSLY